MQNTEILSLQPSELAGWLAENFYIQLPMDIQGEDDIKNAVKITLKLASFEAYLSQLLTEAEIMTRDKKRHSAKSEWEDMVDKKNSISHMCDIVKHQRDALSRSFTFYKYLNDLERL